MLAIGCNEVPKSGGGLYWEADAGVTRDFELGYDSNTVVKAEIVQDVFRRMRELGWLSSTAANKSDEKLATESLYGNNAFLRDSKLFDVIEFGRAVHAEMAAITQAAKMGVSLRSSRLFCTTFPCHICARHIVATGIKEVVFIEPYEKSRTDQLFGDSISVEPHEPSPNRANFRAFVGVAPRRYMDFFAMSGDRKTREGRILGQTAIAENPRIRRFVLTYLIVELKMIDETKRPGAQAGLLDAEEKT